MMIEDKRRHFWKEGSLGKSFNRILYFLHLQILSWVDKCLIELLIALAENLDKFLNFQSFW